MRRLLVLFVGTALSACSADQFSDAPDSGADAPSLDAAPPDALPQPDGGGGDAVGPPVPAWKPLALPNGDTPDLYSVWGTGFNDVWVAGAGGYVAHWNGATFEATGNSGVHLGTNDLRAVWGRGGANKDVLAVGAKGAVYHTTGGTTAWIPFTGATAGKDLVGAANSAGIFFIQSAQGQQFTFDPPNDIATKDLVSSQFAGNLVCNGMHARRAVCNAGVFLDPIANGGNWVRDNLGAPDLFGVWYTGMEFAVVGAGGNAGLAIGMGALSMQKLANADLHGVWVSEDRLNAFAVGDGGTILRGDIANGKAFAPMLSGTTKNLRGVFGVKDAQPQTHVFAVGAAGTVLRLDL